MESIFKKIKRFRNQDFKEGEYFEFTLNPKEVKPRKKYKITVKDYMTKKSTRDFDFMKKWNNDIPMPSTDLVVEFIRETRGMIYAKSFSWEGWIIKSAILSKEEC